MNYEAKLKMSGNLIAQSHQAQRQLKDISAAALALKATQLTPSVEIIRDAARGRHDICKIINSSKPEYYKDFYKHLEIIKSSSSYNTLSAENILKSAQGEVFDNYIKHKNVEYASIYKMNDAIQTIIKYQKDFDNKKNGPISENFMQKIRTLAEAQNKINDLIKNNESEIYDLKNNALLYTKNNTSLWKKVTRWLLKNKEDFYRKSLNDSFAKSFENITKALQEEKAGK